MRVHRIVLLIFAFAFLAQGKSLPSTFSEEANVPIALPLVSINNGYQGIADDFNDDSSENIGEAPPKRPPISQEQTQSNGDKADGLKELKKEFKHGRLNLKHLYKKLAPLLKTSDIQHTGSNIKPTTKSSQQPKKSKNEKQNPSKKSEKTKMDRKSGSGELSHLNLKGLFKKLAPLFKTSPSNKKSGKSHIPLTGMNIPVGKQLFGSMKKPLPHKSSLVHKKSGKPNPKQERPFLDEDIDLEEANMDSETGSGESYQDMFESEEPNNVVGPQLRTGKTGEPNAFGRENTEKTHAPDVNNPRGSLKSDSQLTGTDIPVNMQGFGSIEKALPTLSSLLKKHWPIQNLKRERSSLDKEVDSEEVMDSESGSGESSSKTLSNVRTPPQLGSGDSGNEPFEVRVSEVRWSGMSLAHDRRHDDVSGRGKDKPKNSTEKSGGLSMVVTMLQAIFIVGGILLVVMVTAFFVFAWPVRKYYLHLCRQMDKDRESGQNVELTSIRVDRVHPPEHEYEMPLPPPPLKKVTTAYTPKSAPVAGNLVNLMRARCGLQSNEHLTTRTVEGATHQHEERKAADVMANDKKRDSRNYETRKLIKEQSSQRRNSLVDSIIIAKSIIGDCAKNKKFEKKASRRRHIIKECCLGPESDKGLNEKNVSFADELETACSVIAPDSPYRERLQYSKEKRRAIKEQTSGNRRASLSDDIEIAKSIILESPKRYTLPLNLVQEMINMGMEPKDYVSYYELDFAKPVSPDKVVQNV